MYIFFIYLLSAVVISILFLKAIQKDKVLLSVFLLIVFFMTTIIVIAVINPISSSKQEIISDLEDRYHIEVVFIFYPDEDDVPVVYFETLWPEERFKDNYSCIGTAVEKNDEFYFDRNSIACRNSSIGPYIAQDNIFTNPTFLQEHSTFFFQ